MSAAREAAKDIAQGAVVLGPVAVFVAGAIVWHVVWVAFMVTVAVFLVAMAFLIVGREIRG